jgi:mono/diheme cytochrome c family protein
MRRLPLLNISLLMVLGAFVGAHWLVLPDPSQRNYDFLPDMVASPALDTQYPARIDGAGAPLDLRPAEGSIARGFLPMAYASTVEGAQVAGEELVSPIAEDDEAALARGAAVFATFCSICHGPGGLGTGTVTARGVPPPPSLLAPNAMGMSDGRIYHIISVGQGNMASYASQVTREDRWKTIAFIRGLQSTGETP